MFKLTKFIEREILRASEELIDRLESIIRCHPSRNKPATNFLFSGLYTVKPNGDIVMAQQGIQLNTAYTGKLLFTAAGVQTTGPTSGTVTLDNPSNGTVGLSADGQSINVTVTTFPVTITYAGTNDAGTALTGPTLTLVQADTADAFDFGPLTPGTTT